MMRRRLAPLGLLCLGALLLRLDTLLAASLDWDESVYFLMAKAMGQGHGPYTVVWDHKPPGVYAVFFLAMHLFGSSMIAIRIAACLAVGLSAYLAARIVEELRPEAGWRRWIPSLLVLVTSQKYGGTAANTEIFFAPAIAASILFLIRGLRAALAATTTTTATATTRSRRAPPGALQVLAAGLFAGLAFWMKFNTLIEIALVAAAATLSFLLARAAGAPRLRPVVVAAALFGLGFVAVAGLTVLPFALAGKWPLLKDVLITANLRHVGNRMSLSHAGSYLQDVIETTSLLWMLCFAGLISLSGRPDARWREPRFWLPAVWLVGSLLATLAPGQPYPHYALETVVPLSVLGALVFDELLLRYLPGGRQTTAAVVFLVAGAAGTYPLAIPIAVARQLRSIQRTGSLAEVDGPHAIASFILQHARQAPLGGRPPLRPTLRPTLYVVDSTPMLYDLAGAEPPTKFLFPPFLLDPHFIRVAGVDARGELERILATRPDFLVRLITPMSADADMRAFVDRSTATDYALEGQVDEVQILRRRTP
jgi:4-amino-4-deoxy-L-arabinose transferase-like glycosyltransferase